MKSPLVYFYCREEEGNLQEDVIALAEGFNALGIRHVANINYWQQSQTPGDYLLKQDPSVCPDECDVVVVSYTWPLWIEPAEYKVVRRPLPQGLFKPGRRYRTVYMDHHDGYRTVSWDPEFRQFDLILRAKVNQRAWQPDNMRPWVLGLNRRIIEATGDGLAFGERANRILVNFGASHPYPHGTREIAATEFEPRVGRVIEIDRTKDDLSWRPTDPYDALMWRQTGRRFSRSYYERLKSTQAVACFCGDMIPPAPFRNVEQYLGGGNRARLRRLIFEAAAWFDPRPWRSVQWDSFRFWEALAAGCATFNIDLDRYGVQLPVMPNNWEHYIGIDFDRVDEAVDRMVADPAILERVATAGRQWAFQHYSPKAMAERLLQWTDAMEPRNLSHGVGPAVTSSTSRRSLKQDSRAPLTRVVRKANQTLTWLRSVVSPFDWPSALVLAAFRTRPPVGSGPLDRAARRAFPHIWIRPTSLRGMRIRIDPTRMGHFAIYEEIFVAGLYDLRLLGFAPDVVIDCGAYEGYFTLLARAHCGDVPIVAFEPSADNFAGLLANIRGNDLAIDARASAVSILDGEAPFAGGGCGGHLSKGGSQKSVLVPVADLRRVIAELRPERLLLKVDVEGEERTILPEILKYLPNTCATFFEWHHGQESYKNVVTLLEQSRFHVDARRIVAQPDTGESFIDAFAQRF